MTIDDYPDEQNEKELRIKIAAGSRDPDDYRNLTDFLFPSGGYDEAIALYQRALVFPLTTFKKAQLLMELGWIYYNSGQQAKFTPLAREALSLLSTEPKNAEVLYCLGASQALLALNEFPKDQNTSTEAARLALDWLEKAVADNSDFRDKPHAYIEAALMHSMLGNMDKAIALCERCLAREVNQMQRISCLIVYAQALQREERFVDAEQAIAEAFRYGKNYKAGLFHTLHMELGTIQRFTNRLPESRRSFEQALSALKSDPYFHSDAEILGEIHFNLATACYELGEFQEAISSYSEVLRSHSKDIPAYCTALYWLGRSYEATEDHPKARDCFAEVMASPSATEDDKTLARKALMWVLANLAYESGNYLEAVAKFEEIVGQYPETDPDHWNTFNWLASCYQGLENYTKAQECYQEVLVSRHATDHDKVLARRRLTSSMGKAYYESGSYPEATAAFEEVLISCPENDPDRFHELVWLGYSCHAMGMLARAKDCLERVLASPLASWRRTKPQLEMVLHVYKASDFCANLLMQHHSRSKDRLRKHGSFTDQINWGVRC